MKSYFEKWRGASGTVGRVEFASRRPVSSKAPCSAATAHPGGSIEVLVRSGVATVRGACGAGAEYGERRNKSAAAWVRSRVCRESSEAVFSRFLPSALQGVHRMEPSI